jgi:hypothetical protein
VVPAVGGDCGVGGLLGCEHATSVDMIVIKISAVVRLAEGHAMAWIRLEIKRSSRG